MSEAAVAYAFEQLESAPSSASPSSEELLAQAHAEARLIREQAQADGYAEGQATGRRADHAELQQAAQALARAAQALEGLREQTAQAVEEDAVELALMLAEKVLCGALDARPELLGDIAKGALRRIGERHEAVLLVNPEELAVLQKALAEGGERLCSCELRADPGVAAGGVIAVTEAGEIDVGVQTQLDQAREAMREALQASVSP